MFSVNERCRKYGFVFGFRGVFCRAEVLLRSPSHYFYLHSKTQSVVLLQYNRESLLLLRPRRRFYCQFIQLNYDTRQTNYRVPNVTSDLTFGVIDSQGIDS